MVIGIEESNRRFIETEPIGKAGEACEQKFWDAIKHTFADRSCIGYWCYPLFSKTGEIRKEPDILIVDRELGILIIEVKGITVEQIKSVNGHLWTFQDFYQKAGSPYKQAENQLYSLLAYCDREDEIRRCVQGRAVVALPLITEQQWQEKGFDRLPSCPPIIFGEQLGKSTLLKKIQQTTPVESGKNLSDSQWEILLAVVGGTTIFRKADIDTLTIPHNYQTRSSVIQDLRQRLNELDLQQAHIGLEIPPGPQRIRGIAGSGKTVLLCQKAAHMHLKHPDWDIALVFFTRSLYDQIEKYVDQWLRHFSSGETNYKENPQTKRKLRILHAWGANNRPGFYRTICEDNGQPHLRVPDTPYIGNEGLADISGRLLRSTSIRQIFDAVLIDEGQDLVVDPLELLYKKKQAIYWMAYQSLKPVDDSDLTHKRLIWAYDEAQSLTSKVIPSAPTLFGDSPEFTGFLTGVHKGGIKKSEIMHRCYRTPGPILTAAHAIGMGFLRPGGMLTGINNRGGWEAIGYEVQGDFRKKNEEITLHRPPKNSPNPVPDLWNESVIQFETHNSRQDELRQLAINIKHNLEVDQLKSSREILVVVLGNYILESQVARYLIEQEIDIFIASARRLNQINPRYPDNDPDTFWYEGGITISQINRAKGNEADMVYVVGLDNIARNADDTTLRNQLFVAMTRAKGWVTISGTGDYPLYDELIRVIDAGNTFKFINNPDKPFKRDISDTE